MGYHPTGKGIGWRGAALIGAGLIFLSGCDDAGGFNPFKPQSDEATAEPTSAASGKTIERDVEAPEVFQATDQGLWDGRPSLGGIWVAHPDVGEPQRVIIRNTENSKSIVGALFRRERENPGPILQVSSDAAAALGMLAGAPVELNVIALRREEVPDPEAPAVDEVDQAEPAEDAAVVAVAPSDTTSEPGAIETTTLDPVAGATAAIEEIEAGTVAASSAAVTGSETSTAPEPAQETSSLRKPFIQLGIFSIEQNAKDAAESMRRAGMVPMVKEQEAGGKKLWRVLVGPANTRSERTALLRKIKGAGFGDAYPVTN